MQSSYTCQVRKKRFSVQLKCINSQASLMLTWLLFLTEELMKYLTKDQNTTESGTGTAFEIVPPAQSDSVGMKHRILKVVERLGFGSFSQVFKVQCRFTKKFYAVKCISVGNFVELTKPSGIGDAFDYFRKLLREVQIMAMLQENPNIISYHETWFEGTLQNRLYELLEKYDEIPSPQMSLRLTTEDKVIIYQLEILNVS